jgi:methionyl-tRNA synthetase
MYIGLNMKEKILITSALPYANGPLHFGHIAGAYLPADCYARFQRLLQNDVLYICGSDEYGVAVAMSAEIAGRSPQEHVDIFHEINKNLFHKLNISFDHFSRTTWKGHNELTHQYFLDLIANGFIEEKITDQLYSEKDKKFLADRYVVGTCPKCGFQNARGDECPKCAASYEATDLKNPRSKLTDAPLTLKQTKHWFLMLDKFKDRLTKWLETKNWKPNVINFIKGYIQDLHPRAITRDSKWGIPLPFPGADDKVLYVWFDAPIGYLSATKEWGMLKGDSEKWKEYWCDPKTKLINFIGKDNIPFHAAIFPAMTMGQNQPYKLVDELPANEFYNLEGKQFSKSDGWYIDLEDFFKRYTTDQIRYAIAANAPETSDSEFTWKDFQLRCNSDLLGKYGNLVNRVMVFAKNNCGGVIPFLTELTKEDSDFLDNIRNLVEQAAINYQSFKVRRASQIVMELAQLGNIYFDGKRPWLLAKDPAKQREMNTTIACCFECIKAMALISNPIIPEASENIWKLLGYPHSLQSYGWTSIVTNPNPTGQKLLEPKILFQRIEDKQIEEELTKLQSLSVKPPQNKLDSNYTPLKDAVDIDLFRKLDFRIATILHAVPVPKSKKLLHLHLDLGFEKRYVVSGISQFYQPEQLVGKKIIVVANLKPVTLMGVESHGMILAGSAEESMEVLTVKDLPPGTVIS